MRFLLAAAPATTGPTPALPDGATPAPVPALPGVCEAAGDGLYRLPDVVFWNEGWHKDSAGRWQFYSGDDCQRIADNFATLKQSADPHLEPPAALGHEEEQARLRALLRDDDAFQKYVAGATGSPHCRWTDAPAAGWPDGVRYESGRGVTGSLERIPPVIRGMIDGGELKFLSPEIYDNFHYRGKDFGPVMRRVSLLGSQPPGNKSLPPLGQRSFSDGYGTYTLFADVPAADVAESKNTDRAEQAAKLRSLGVPAKAVQALDGLSVANWRLFYTAYLEGVADLALGDDPMSQTTDTTAANKAGTSNYSDPAKSAVTPPAETKPAVPAEFAAFADAMEKRFEAREAAREAAWAERERSLSAFAEEARRESIAAASRRKEEGKRACRAFVDTEVDAGRLLPRVNTATAELPALADLLAMTPGEDPVHKFTDRAGDEKVLSLRELWMRTLEELAKDHPRKFGDRIPGGKPEQADGVSPERKKELLSMTPLGQAALSHAGNN